MLRQFVEASDAKQELASGPAIRELETYEVSSQLRLGRGAFRNDGNANASFD